MQEMSNLDYHYALAELAELAGARLSKVYQTGRTLRLRFNKQGAEHNLLVVPGKRAHLTKYIEEPPKQPPHFAAALRSIVDNAVLAGVDHVNFDRLFALVLRKDKTYRLVFEMFGGGNAALCAEDGTIIHVLERAEYATRRVAPKQKYSAPPSEKKDFRTASEGDLKGLKGKAVAAVSKTFNLAPFYAEEACARAGVKADKEISGLAEGETRRLADALAGLAKETKPTLYLKAGKPAFFSPFPLKKLEGQGLEEKAFASFNELLDEYYQNAPAPSAEEKPARESRKLEKLRFSLDQEKAALKEFEEKAKELRAKGEAIYAHYDVAEEALAAVRKKKAEGSEAAVIKIDL